MQRRVIHTLAAAAALAAFAGSAQAQGKGHGKGHGNKDWERQRAGQVVTRRSDGEVERDREWRDRRAVPPGLAKKPRQIPPGQYKKAYSSAYGATVLSDVFRQRGYPVTRLESSGETRYVYYRLPDGTVQRAVVNPSPTRLTFGNVPATILQAVLAQLY